MIAAGLPRSYWIVWCSTLVNHLCTFLIFLLPLYLTDARHLSLSLVGAVVACASGANSLGLLTGGFCADRWGRTRTIQVANTVAATSVFALVFVSQWQAVAALVTQASYANGAARPALFALIGDLVEAGDRVRAYSLLSWATNIGLAGAAAGAGLLTAKGYTPAFALEAVATLMSGLLIFRGVKDSGPSEAAPGRNAKAEDVRLLHDTVFLVFTLCGFLLALVLTQKTFALPLAIRADHLPAHVYGNLLAGSLLYVAVLQPLLIKLVTRLDKNKALAVGAALVGLGFGSLGLADSIPVYVLAMLLWSTGEVVGTCCASATLLELSPAQARGTYQGAAMFTFSAAGFAGPLVTGLLMHDSSSSMVWTACLALSGMSGLLHFLSGPRRNAQASLRSAVDS
ncbi:MULTISPECIES: MFS transporter [unclassified Streptomyces]|uniref:MFS transporter n=1 Tax=unclassified Streptomyces TaxID=2593676 RepID=UPI002366477C|nr:MULTISPECIES: MFS transporter [unclassified Streptomyces]MDF3141165.1 MFS transporter [Streptomyces sp. T21Q-yed]WDF41408.1 MFS transporter [Streptomyces sp. T12]